MADFQGRDSGRSTADCGNVKLTIASNVASGSDQNCKRVLLCAPSGNTGPVYMAFDDTADADGFLIPEEEVVELFVSNLSYLNFYSGTDGDTIRVWWEN
jgi:hypothetical protein